jgi:hypothetical protein
LITEGHPIFYGRLSEIPINCGRNLVWDTKAGSPRGRINKFDEIEDIDFAESGNLVADPKIADIEKADFTLAPDSPAYTLGFSPLPEKVAKG